LGADIKNLSSETLRRADFCCDNMTKLGTFRPTFSQPHFPLPPYTSAKTRHINILVGYNGVGRDNSSSRL